jgi:DNA invertase Pin-like site-specific DNA recombinase
MGAMRKRSNGVATLKLALVYTRVSGYEQEREGLSLPAQLANCRRYTSAHGWPIYVEYQDAMTGKRDDRPSYQELLAEVRRLRAEGQQVVVVVNWLHRLGRRVLERARVWEELDKLGAVVHSVAEGGQVPKLVADVLAAVAEEESRQIGDRVSSTWRHINEQGWPKIGRVAWGYRLRPATHDERKDGSPKSALEVDPATAPFVVEAFQRVANGASGRSVALWVAHLPAEATGGRRMAWGIVQGALRKPLYVARPVNGDDDVLSRPVGRWPALVTDELWQHVEARMAGHKRLAHQASGRYLLAGILRCRVCARPMRGDKTSPAGRYRCVGEAQHYCTETVSRKVDAETLQRVGAMLDRVLHDPHVQAGLRRGWQQRQRSEDGVVESRTRTLEGQIERSRQRISRGTELFVDGSIQREEYDELVARARAEGATAEAALGEVRRAPVRQTLPPLSEVLRAARSWSEILKESDVVAQREVLERLVDQVVAHRERVNVYRVEITYTSLGCLFVTLGA